VCVCVYVCVCVRVCARADLEPSYAHTSPHRSLQEGAHNPPLTKEETIGLVKDVFISAAERDIYTGDAVVLHIITKDGVEVQRMELRRD
jgi:20S proteasome alpha/beta subunit